MSITTFGDHRLAAVVATLLTGNFISATGCTEDVQPPVAVRASATRVLDALGDTTVKNWGTAFNPWYDRVLRVTTERVSAEFDPEGRLIWVSVNHLRHTLFAQHNPRHSWTVKSERQAVELARRQVNLLGFAEPLKLLSCEMPEQESEEPSLYVVFSLWRGRHPLVGSWNEVRVEMNMQGQLVTLHANYLATLVPSLAIITRQDALRVAGQSWEKLRLPGVRATRATLAYAPIDGGFGDEIKPPPHRVKLAWVVEFERPPLEGGAIWIDAETGKVMGGAYDERFPRRLGPEGRKP